MKTIHKNSVNRKIQKRNHIDTLEVRKIITLNLDYLSQMIFSHLIEKYIYFFNNNILNSKDEFYQSHDDIRIGLRGSVSDYLIKKAMDELIKKGFISRTLKVPEGFKTNIPKHHYNLNMELLDNIIITPDEHKLPSKEKYKIHQDIKYAKKPNPTKETVLSDSKDFKSSDELEPTKKETTQPEPPKEATEPIKVVQWMTFESNNVNNDKIELFIKHLDNPKVKAMLKDLNVSTDDIRYYYSGCYKRGLKKDKDNIKDSLDIIHNQILQSLEGKSIIF